MDSRYTHHRLADLWSRHTTIGYWTCVEQATADAQAKLGLIPLEAARAINAAGPPSVAMVDAAEFRTHHDLAAFVEAFSNLVEAAHRRWVHHGLTSSDIVDTANAIRISQATRILCGDAQKLTHELAALGQRHPVWRLGRTHGQAADPVRFDWQMARLAAAVDRAANALEVGGVPMKLSGPVGSYAYNPEGVEFTVAQDLGLDVCQHSSQVVPRDFYARWAFDVVQLACAVEAIATEIRIGAQDGIDELTEYFEPGQVGSSAMPHKHNPIRSERLCGLARVARAYLFPILETSGGLWSERDISNSSVERVALRDLACLTGWMVTEATAVVQGLLVHNVTIADNLATLALPTPAARLWHAVRSGVERDVAYQHIQKGESGVQAAENNWREWDLMSRVEWYGLNYPLAKASKTVVD